MGVWLQAASDVPSTGYGAALLQMLLALAAVCVLAVVALRWGARGGLGALGGRGAKVRVIERVHLDARRALYLVRVGDKVLLVGAGDGPLSVLCEVDPKTLPEEPEARATSFADVLDRFRRK
ncbi:MAG: flagellar biosynthetic protein FliO [Deltaproteobacteria bacterium]|nr:flagellar biosynthetic protein FliO [Deltaproteobacteria bacterium]